MTAEAPQIEVPAAISSASAALDAEQPPQRLGDEKGGQQRDGDDRDAGGADRGHLLRGQLQSEQDDGEPQETLRLNTRRLGADRRAEVLCSAMPSRMARIIGLNCPAPGMARDAVRRDGDRGGQQQAGKNAVRPGQHSAGGAVWARGRVREGRRLRAAQMRTLQAGNALITGLAVSINPTNASMDLIELSYECRGPPLTDPRQRGPRRRSRRPWRKSASRSPNGPEA